MRVVGYVRVSTEEQAESRAGLEAQRQAITDDCARRDWELVEILEDAGYSAKNLKRPAVQEALSALKRRQADGLVVAKLDRLSRSMLDFTVLLDRAQKQGWALVSLDCVDTSSPNGEAMASMLAVFSQLERRLIGQRTQEALAKKRAHGVRLGRPPQLPAVVAERIVSERRGGRSLAAIAETLNSERVATAHGGRRWYASTVRAVLRSAQAAEDRAHDLKSSLFESS